MYAAALTKMITPFLAGISATTALACGKVELLALDEVRKNRNPELNKDKLNKCYWIAIAAIAAVGVAFSGGFAILATCAALNTSMTTFYISSAIAAAIFACAQFKAFRSL